jgi:N-acetylmuramoyl-L-alanine amidase
VFSRETEQIASAEASDVVADRPIHILVVPGHEPSYGGAEYRDRLERDMVAELASTLVASLAADPRFMVSVTRDATAWNPVFAEYFNKNATAIKIFYAEKLQLMQTLLATGAIKSVAGVPHNSAPAGVSDRLYGINMWSNEQAVDVVLNLHINDVPRPDVSKPGIYRGLAIYVPERQYANSSSSIAIAKPVFEKLRQLFPVSNLPFEEAGIVEDQELIAIGKYNTLDAASLLIEYGYIYEVQYDDPAVRSAVLQNAAILTALGIKDYFVTTTAATSTAKTSLGGR